MPQYETITFIFFFYSNELCLICHRMKNWVNYLTLFFLVFLSTTLTPSYLIGCVLKWHNFSFCWFFHQHIHSKAAHSPAFFFLFFFAELTHFLGERKIRWLEEVYKSMNIYIFRILSLFTSISKLLHRYLVEISGPNFFSLVCYFFSCIVIFYVISISLSLAPSHLLILSNWFFRMCVTYSPPRHYWCLSQLAFVI